MLGLAIDDYAAIVFENFAPTSVIVEQPEANAYVVDRSRETRLGTDGDSASGPAGTLPRRLLRRVL
ncbi:hypothetical protein GCM10009689_14320 [Brevibacterium antiquum]